MRTIMYRTSVRNLSTGALMIYTWSDCFSPSSIIITSLTDWPVLGNGIASKNVWNERWWVTIGNNVQIEWSTAQTTKHCHCQLSSSPRTNQKAGLYFINIRSWSYHNPHLEIISKFWSETLVQEPCCQHTYYRARWLLPTPKIDVRFQPPVPGGSSGHLSHTEN